MEDRKPELLPEDYTDPACPFCTDAYENKPSPRQIPIGRIMEKLDGYYASDDSAAAERHILYWLSEASANGDEAGEFTLRNDLMGLYRKCGRTEEAKAEAEKTLSLARRLGILDRLEGGTALLNAATVCKACGEPEKSIHLFEQAQEVYDRLLGPDDPRRAGLHNNMGLTLCDLRRFAEARESYRTAIRILNGRGDGQTEEAITWLNLASLAETQYGLESDRAQEEIAECLRNAEELLECGNERTDGDYAFACEKCAQVFGHYGYFMTESVLKERAKKIYERT